MIDVGAAEEGSRRVLAHHRVGAQRTDAADQRFAELGRVLHAAIGEAEHLVTGDAEHVGRLRNFL
jgi:hypothetical protein